MNLKQSLGRTSRLGDDELNITPVMNIFLILVPFLLLTAVFVKISIVEFSLPSGDARGQNAQDPKTAPVVTILSINKDGFELKSKGVAIPFIRNKQAEFNFPLLVKKLEEVKKRHRSSEDIIIAPQEDIKYNTLIQVMDRCRESGFPNISISG